MPDTFRDMVGCLLDNAMCVFGETIRYCPKTGNEFTIVGVFDDQFEQVDADTEQLIASNQMTLGIKLADLKTIVPKKGDRVVRKTGEHFRVLDSQEDGHGGSMLIMHRITKRCK